MGGVPLVSRARGFAVWLWNSRGDLEPAMPSPQGLSHTYGTGPV